MTSKSQTELEQPAKVYQLEAVDKKVDQALAMLKTISESVSGVVTESQLDKRLKDLATDIKEDIHKEVDLKYGSTKTTVKTWSKRMWSVFIGVLLSLLGNAITAYKLFGG